jgi:patatin-like phospholipase/acyl hydrolase
MPAKELIKILSIDGGGIRGIIPSMLLAEIERQTEQPACELFDLIAGTSIGGIIALGVTVPSEEVLDGKGKEHPRWRAQDLVDLHVKEGPKIFHRSLLRTIETVDGLLVQKYSPTGLEAALERYMGEVRLPDALTDVLITSYDIHKHEPFFFKSFQPRARAAPNPRDSAIKRAGLPSPPQPPSDYPMRMVARATSAAPTYFPPERVPLAPPLAVQGPPGQGPPGEGPPDYVLVDGGTFANNPAMCAYAEARRNHPDAEVLIVSLGTGRLTDSISYGQARHWGLVQWARPLLGVIMDGSSAAIDYQLDELLGADVGHFRFQAALAGVSDSLDDASASNIKGLSELAQRTISENADRLAAVCERLAPGLREAAVSAGP